MITYPHRRNSDGTFDSICPECFRTVARVSIEVELAAAEAAHRCDAWRLEELRRDRGLRARLDFPAEAEMEIKTRSPVRVRAAA
jgi:hypothetical protein